MAKAVKLAMLTMLVALGSSGAAEGQASPCRTGQSKLLFKTKTICAGEVALTTRTDQQKFEKISVSSFSEKTNTREASSDVGDWWISVPGAEQIIVSFSEEYFIFAQDALLFALRDRGEILTFFPESSYVVLVGADYVDNLQLDIEAYLTLNVSASHTSTTNTEDDEYLWIDSYPSSLKVAPELNRLRDDQQVRNSARGNLTIDGVADGDKSFFDIYLDDFDSRSEDQEGLKGLFVSIVDVKHINYTVIALGIEEAITASGVTYFEMAVEQDDEIISDRAQVQVSVFALPQDIPYVAGVLSQLPFVQWVEPRLQSRIGNIQASSIVQSGIVGRASSLYGKPLWDSGITGRGQIVGTGDTGVDLDSCYFEDDVPTSSVHRKIVYYRDLADRVDANGHGTHTAGSIAGLSEGDNPSSPSRNSGIAPESKLIVVDLGAASGAYDGSLIIPRGGLSSYYQWSYDRGARIHSDSWGTSSTMYSSLSRSVDVFTWINQDFLPVFSSGNDGDLLASSTVSDPATAKNGLAVGASLGQKSSPPRGFGESYDIVIEDLPEEGAQFSGPLNLRVLRGEFGQAPRLFSGLRAAYSAGLVAGIPSLGCSPLQNSAAVSGKYVLLTRGECLFSEKVRTAQQAGALGVIVANDKEGGHFKMGVGDEDRGLDITIAALATTRAIGDTLREYLSQVSNGELSIQLKAATLPEDTFENMATFSSYGPTEDGRTKPDITAPGDRIESARSGRTCDTIIYSGTSMSTPLIAGSAALVRQYFVDGYYPSGAQISSDGFSPSGALIKAVLLNGAQNMRGFTDIGLPLEVAPSFRQGFGLARLNESLSLGSDSSHKMYVLNDRDVTTGSRIRLCVRVEGGEENSDLLRATVAWHDYPAALGAGAILVNNVDLNIYDGNGNSIRSSGDNINNVERQILVNPSRNRKQSYSFIVEVLGKRISVNKNNYFPRIGQPFGLALTGNNLSVREIEGDDCGPDGPPEPQSSSPQVQESPSPSDPEPIPEPISVDIDSCACSTNGRSGSTLVNVVGCGQHNSPTSSTFFCYVQEPATCTQRTFSSSNFPGALWRTCDPSVDPTRGENDEENIAEKKDSTEQPKGPCSCTPNGKSGSVQTGYIGCYVPQGILDTNPYCYVTDPDSCEEARPSAAFPGAALRDCSP